MQCTRDAHKSAFYYAGAARPSPVIKMTKGTWWHVRGNETGIAILLI